MRKRAVEIPLYQRPGPVLTGGGGSPVASAEGVLAGTRLAEQFAAGVEKLTGTTIGLVGQLQDAKRKVRAREIDNELSLEFHKRFIDQSMNVRGTDVDGLLDREHEELTRMDANLEKRFNIEDKQLGEMVRARYSALSNSYLNKLAGHALNELETADQTSRTQAVQVELDILSDSAPGDNAALENFVARVSGVPDETGKRVGGIYSDRFQHKILPTIDAGVNTMVEAWAYQDPEVTEQWVKDNEKQLRMHLGEGYTKVIDSMRQGLARKRADDNQAYQEVQRHREEVKRRTNEDFVQKWADGKLTTNEILASELPPTGVGSKKWWIDQLAKGAGTGAPKNNPRAHLMFVEQASSGELDSDALFAAAEDGLITPTTVGTLLSMDKTAKKNAGKPYDNAWKDVKKEIFSSLVVGDLLTAKNPKDVEAANNCAAYFQQHLESLDSDQERLDFLRNRELVTGIIRSFRAPGTERMKSTLEQLRSSNDDDMTPDQLRKAILSGQIPPLPPLPGESSEEYAKRVGL